MSTTPAFASTADAMEMVRAGLVYLAAADPAEMPAQVQADYLRAQEQNDAISQVCSHRWGWTLVLHPDGTTTAWNRNKTKVLRSHSPPAEAG